MNRDRKAKNLFQKKERAIFRKINSHLNLNLEEQGDTVLLSGDYQNHEMILRRCIIDETEMVEVSFPLSINIKGTLAFIKRIPRRMIQRGYRRIEKQTGDISFDKKIIIEGKDSLFLTAMLSKHNRFLIKSLFGASSSIIFKSTGLVLQLSLYRALRAGQVKQYVDSVCSLLESIPDGDTKSKLLVNIKKERKAQLKISVMKELGKHFGSDDDVVQMMQKMLGYKNKGIQIAAARFLGKEGNEYVAAMLKRYPRASVEYKIEIVRNFRYNRYKPAKDLIVAVFKKTSSSRLKVEILDALHAFNDPDFTSFLSKEFNYKRNFMLEVKLTIAELLVNRGAKSIIPEIEKFLDSLNFDLKHVPEEVVVSAMRIQAKLDSAKGMLSTAEYSEQEGALSLAKDTLDGALSVDETDE